MFLVRMLCFGKDVLAFVNLVIGLGQFSIEI